MITALLFKLFEVVLAGLDSLLPDWTLPDLSAWALTIKGKLEATNVLRFVAGANHYFPISEAVTVFGLLAVVWLAVMLYHFVVWTLSKMHVLGGGA